MFNQKQRIIALACVGIAGLLIDIQSAHAQTASWLNGEDGDFTDGSKWSTSPDYPNGAGSIAVIAAPGPGYAVSLDSSVLLASFTLNAHALFDLSGTLAAGTVTISSGTFLLDEGTIAGATVTTAGLGRLVLNSNGGNLDGVILDTNFTDPSTTLTVYHGLTLSSRRLMVNSGSDQAVVNFSGPQTIGGTGTIQFDGTRDDGGIQVLNDAMDNGTLTIGSGITVQTGAAGGVINGNTLINNGTILANVAGKTINVDAATFTNHGSIIAGNGATVDLGGTITLGGLGTFSDSGGTVSLSGTLINTNTILALAAPNQILTFNGGTILGGDISTSNGGKLLLTNNHVGQLDNVALDDTDIFVDSSELNIYHSLALFNSTITLHNDPQTLLPVLRAFGPQSIGGSGVIEFDGDSDRGAISAVSDGLNPGTLSFGANITVRTGTTGGLIHADSLINNGTLLAQAGHTLEIEAPILNGGTLLATSNARLLIDGTFDISGTGTMLANTGGIIEINGTTAVASATTGSFRISGGDLLISGNLSVGANAILQKLGDGTMTLSGTQTWGAGSKLEMAAGTTNFRSDPGGNLALHINATTVHFQGGFSDPILKFEGLSMNTPGTGILDPGGNLTVQTHALSIDVNDGGKMDLNDNKFVVDYDPAGGDTDPIDTIKGYISHAYDGGAWDGTGLGSTFAATIAADITQSHKTAVGYAEASAIFPGNSNPFGAATVDDTAIVMRYTLAGDANLDGNVDTTDFAMLADGFGQSNQYWSQGDFNYDGVVNALDFNAIAANYGSDIPPQASAALGAIPGSMVPEPLGIGTIALGLGSLVRRRRR